MFKSVGVEELSREERRRVIPREIILKEKLKARLFAGGICRADRYTKIVVFQQ